MRDGSGHPLDRRNWASFPLATSVQRVGMRLKPWVYGFCIAVFLSGTVLAQSLYKYQDEDGRWVYTDRQPTNESEVEVRNLSSGPKPVGLLVETSVIGRSIRFTATNDYAAPVEIQLQLVELTNLQAPDTNQKLQ